MSVDRGCGERERKGFVDKSPTSHKMTNTKSPTATTSIARGGCGCRKEPFDNLNKSIATSLFTNRETAMLFR